MYFIEGVEEMPAQQEEVEDAINDGVNFHFYTNPVKILGEKHKVNKIVIQRMKPGEFDRSGRRRPIVIANSEFEVRVDNVIVAIGQQVDEKISILQTNKNGTLKVDKDTLETSIPGIFAGGDCVLGPATVIEAISHGHKAAIAIDKYLGGVMYKRIKTHKRKADYDIYEQPMENVRYKSFAT